MKLKLISVAILTFFFFALPMRVLPQMVTMNAFDIAPPTLLTEVKAIRSANPKMTTAEFLEAANVLIGKQGVPFTFAFDAATCEAIDKSIKSLKNAPPQVSLRTKLKSVGGEPAMLKLPPADFANNECGKCSITLPVLEIGETQFVALMTGTNIKFDLPANFKAAEALLLDEKDPAKIKTRWRVPYRSKPLGVSYDGGVIYLALPDPELKDLALAVFREGVFQFATRADAESNGVGKPSPGTPANPAIANSSTIVFDNRGTKQLVQYADACGK